MSTEPGGHTSRYYYYYFPPPVATGIGYCFAARHAVDLCVCGSVRGSVCPFPQVVRVTSSKGQNVPILAARLLEKCL